MVQYAFTKFDCHAKSYQTRIPHNTHFHIHLATTHVAAIMQVNDVDLLTAKKTADSNRAPWLHGPKFNPDDYASSKLVEIGSWPGSVFAPRGIAVDGDGNVIVVGNGKEAGVKKLTKSGWKQISSGGSNLWGMALCPNGNVSIPFTHVSAEEGMRGTFGGGG